MKNIKRGVKKALLFHITLDDRIREWGSRRAWLSRDEISQYRKKIKIYDVFLFFNELDLLEIRLNILNDYVDYFVIVEATETFSGYPKPLYYNENKLRFKKWEHKIIHSVIYTTPKNGDDLKRRLSDNTGDTLEKQIIKYALASNTVGIDDVTWLREFYQKESIRKTLENLQDNDICYVSDLDEIWNPELVIDYSKNDVFKLRQVAYLYYLNNRSDGHWQGWTGTMVTKYKNIKNSCLNDLLKNGKSRQIGLKNGGWHFTFQGGFQGAKRKIEEFNHPEYAQKKTIPNLEMMVSENRDYKGRNTKLWVDERGLPKYLLENKDKYIKFFK